MGGLPELVSNPMDNKRLPNRNWSNRLFKKANHNAVFSARMRLSSFTVVLTDTLPEKGTIGKSPVDKKPKNWVSMSVEKLVIELIPPWRYLPDC